MVSWAIPKHTGGKMIIDATRQLPGEGGPAAFPKTNREILTTLAPEAFTRVDAKWGDLIG